MSLGKGVRGGYHEPVEALVASEIFTGFSWISETNLKFDE
jgi:hypothetical protein